MVSISRNLMSSKLVRINFCIIFSFIILHFLYIGSIIQMPKLWLVNAPVDINRSIPILVNEIDQP